MITGCNHKLIKQYSTKNKKHNPGKPDEIKLKNKINPDEDKTLMNQKAKQNLRYIINELFNIRIRIRTFGRGFITIDKWGVVVNDGNPFRSVTFPLGAQLNPLEIF